MLFHELDDYTMTEAMKWYPKLKESFDVRVFYRVCFSVLIHSILWLGKTAHRSCRRRLQRYPPIR